MVRFLNADDLASEFTSDSRIILKSTIISSSAIREITRLDVSTAMIRFIRTGLQPRHLLYDGIVQCFNRFGTCNDSYQRDI